MSSTVRNILIILSLAALVALLPHGGQGASIAIQAVSLAFLGALEWVAFMTYRQRRVDLYALGDSKRLALYASAGVIALTLTASQRLWSSPGGEIAWFVLLAGAAYAAFAVIWSARKY